MTIAFDSNVVVSALLNPSGKPRLALDWAKRYALTIYSDASLAELVRTLQKPKLQVYLKGQPLEALIRLYLFQAVRVELPNPIPRICRDPQDDHLLALAQAGGASVLVTGDLDLLVLHPWQGVSILSPQDFLQMLPGQ